MKTQLRRYGFGPLVLINAIYAMFLIAAVITDKPAEPYAPFYAVSMAAWIVYVAINVAIDIRAKGGE